MSRIRKIEIYAVDLPFRKPFKHSAAERASSYSLFLKGTTENGAVGFGECLPREYVTGESRDGAFELLHQRIVPRLLELDFETFGAVLAFLERCDGKAPEDWVDADEPQGAAWCTVDLMLLDAFGKQNGVAALPVETGALETHRYSGVTSAEADASLVKSALKMRFYGIRQVKVKVDENVGARAIEVLRRWLGRGAELRVDANMLWSEAQALSAIPELARLGVESFEQPIAADNLAGLTKLVRETGQRIMVDESFTDRESLVRLLEKRACNAVNVRISKCGGLIASKRRCREAIEAGLVVQIGCQVGESSLLSAAHLRLCALTTEAKYLEGCFGLHLLREDPARPLLQFGFGGRPPKLPEGPGLGITIDEKVLERFTSRKEKLGAA